MAEPSGPDKETMDRLTEAAAWRVELADAGVETTAAFEEWLAEDPRNTGAWRRIQGPWIHIGEHATAPELMAAREDALNDARRHGRRRWRAGAPWSGAMLAAGLALAMIVGGGYGLTVWKSQPRVYATALGERRVIPLDDGSRVSLDSGTEIRIRFTKDARRLELVRGQARFDVAHDEQRPFSVKARNDTVVATGTAFNVDLLGPKVLVTLIEGKVVVLDTVSGRSARHRKINLVAGQQLILPPRAEPTVEMVRVDRASAWETGDLMFEDEPLASVAQRVSRYTDAPITVDSSVADLKISGVFKAGDVGIFIDAVTAYLPVSANRQVDGSIALRSRG